MNPHQTVITHYGITHLLACLNGLSSGVHAGQIALISLLHRVHFLSCLKRGGAHFPLKSFFVYWFG